MIRIGDLREYEAVKPLSDNYVCVAALSQSYEERYDSITAIKCPIYTVFYLPVLPVYWHKADVGLQEVDYLLWYTVIQP